MNNIEQIITSGWAQPKLLNYLLLPLGAIYRVLFLIHRGLYRLGIKSQYSAPVPVVVVGNLTVGGTGKTPTVIALSKELKSRGKKVAIISRGYGSVSSAEPKLIDFVNQASADICVRQVGDEPYLIAKNTELPVMVCANRAKSIKALLAKYDLDVIVSDDGLQHHALKADIKICIHDETIDAQNTFLFPAGPYREPISAMQNTDLVLRHTAQGSQNNLAPVNANVPSFVMSLAVDGIKSVKEPAGNTKPVLGDTVHAVAGIGNPKRFFNSLCALGFNIIEHVYPDHHDYQQSDLIFDDDFAVLMTEKDAVKCTALNVPNMWYLGVAMTIDDEFYQALNSKLSLVSKA